MTIADSVAAARPRLSAAAPSRLWIDQFRHEIDIVVFLRVDEDMFRSHHQHGIDIGRCGTAVKPRRRLAASLALPLTRLNCVLFSGRHGLSIFLVNKRAIAAHNHQSSAPASGALSAGAYKYRRSASENR
jgi:hypothetical protein